MKQVVLLIVLGLLSISLGLGIYADAAGMQIRTLVHQGLTRTYHVCLPPGHSRSKAAPLVIALHGGGGNGENMDRSTGRQITREADRRSWVTVFPEGVNIGVRYFMHTGLIWRKNLPVPFPLSHFPNTGG